MGCCGSKSTYGVEPDAIPGAIKDARDKFGKDILLMAIKDQNVPGKLCFSGDTASFENELDTLLKGDSNNKDVKIEKDKYDLMYDTVWRNTSLTTGHSTFSLAKSYFPRGKLLVSILDLLARHGWLLSAAPNFGGVESTDDKGNVTSTVDWPVFIFYKEKEASKYTEEHLFFAVKDSNIPGKLCAAGPVGSLEGALLTKLQAFTSDAKSEKDSYDEDFDVVWRNTKITSGASIISFEKSYFPKGKTNIAILDCAYSFGWRAIAAPNFGGTGDSWPCVVFRKLKDWESCTPPKVVLASIKDSNIPGKLCFAGSPGSCASLVPAVCAALQKVPKNEEVKQEKDSYDETGEYDEVLRNTIITSGAFSSFFGLEYFPKCDSVTTFLDTMTQQGYTCVACPNFGGMTDSWPTFIFEETPNPAATMWVAVKDENIPGKFNLGGGDIKSDATLTDDLMSVLKSLCGPNVVLAKDQYDESYEYCFKNTVLTSGHATFTFAKPYWPHGYVIEALLLVLLKHGWMATGGPNFGNNGTTWPGIVMIKTPTKE